MGKRLVEVLGNINIVGEGYKRKFMQVEMLLPYYYKLLNRCNVLKLSIVLCIIIVLNKSCKEVFLKEILIGQEQEVY